MIFWRWFGITMLFWLGFAALASPLSFWRYACLTCLTALYGPLMLWIFREEKSA